MPHLKGLFLICAGSIVMVWVGWLTWFDMTEWGKDIGSIFLGSRTGEAISLGIGMKVLHYFLISLSLIGAGSVLFLGNRILNVKSVLTMKRRLLQVNVEKLKNLSLDKLKYGLFRTKSGSTEKMKKKLRISGKRSA
jgi:hypothetical protein